MIFRRNKSGFTMVELLVVLAVSSILMSLMFQVYKSQLKSHTTQQELVEMQQNMRAVLYLMEREIRMAGHGPNGGVADPSITTAQIDSIAFAMDLTGGTSLEPSDGDTGDAGERISYFIDGGTGALVRNATDGNGDQVLLPARDINLLTFVYKGSDGITLDDDGAGNLTTTVSLQAIRSVEIVIDASIGTTAMVESHAMQLRSEVKVRNLGLVP
jgi:type IV pilus assembly protein PilW